MNFADEKDLIASLQRDDRAAINAIFVRYHASLCRVAFRLVRDTDEAKDIVQEVFIKLWRNRKTLSIAHSLEAYLKRAVVNTSLNRLESNRKHIPFDPFDPALHRTGEVVDEEQTSRELSAQIDSAINSLPVRTRAVFTLVRHEEMSYKDVAESLSISLKAVEKEMMKALKLLREALKDYLPILILSLIATA